jgi:hypothetical protein
MSNDDQKDENVVRGRPESVLAQRKQDSLLGSVAKSGVAVEWFG